ncbi:MAG TPA: hypothetical protein VNJ53_13280 [Gaiellaceae bacterium]|nr:hypothetical protein [Gaiellaceae bacterium]
MRRSWLLAAALAAAAVIVVGAVLLLRGDEGGGPSAEEWAGSVCASLVEWRDSITALADVSGGTLTAESLRERLDSAETATESLVTELRELGPPEVEAGQTVDRELDALVSGLQAGYDELRAGAQEALDASSPAEFLRGLAELAPAFQRLLESVAGATERLLDADLPGEARAELEQAFADAEACQALSEER